MNARAILPGNRGHHAVQFYQDDRTLCVSVVDFLADGLAAAQPTLIIATPEHRTGILDELKRRRFDVGSLILNGAVLLLDARDTLNRFLVDGRVNGARFREVVGDALALLGGRDGETVRAYGEMVDLLWHDGHPEAALELETLWNELGKKRAFSLLCGYAQHHAHLQHAAVVEEICRHHTHVYESVS